MQDAVAKGLRVNTTLVEMSSFSQRQVRRASKSTLMVGYRIILPEDRELLTFSRTIKFLVNSGSIDTEVNAIQVNERIELAEPPRAIGPGGYVCDPATHICPTEPGIVSVPQNEGSSSFSLPFETVLIIILSSMGTILCCCLTVCCYMTRFRLIKDLLKSRLMPKPNVRKLDERAINPLDRPNGLRFEKTLQPNQKMKSKNQNDQDQSDTTSLKSGKTRVSTKSSIKFTRSSANDIAPSVSEWDDISSMQSMSTDYSVFSHLKSPDRRRNTALSVASRASRAASFDHASPKPLHSPLKSQHSSPHARNPSLSARMVSFEHHNEEPDHTGLSDLSHSRVISRRPTSVSCSSLSVQTHSQAVGNFASSTISNRINQILQDQSHLDLRQHHLMSMAGLIDKAPVSVHREPFHAHSSAPKSPGFDNASTIKDVTSLDPWFDRGKPPQLWEPASTLSRPQSLFHVARARTEAQPEVYIKDWLQQQQTNTSRSEAPQVTINYSVKSRIAHFGPPEDFPSMPTYITSRMALEDIESPPARSRRNAPRVTLPQASAPSAPSAARPAAHCAAFGHPQSGGQDMTGLVTRSAASLDLVAASGVNLGGAGPQGLGTYTQHASGWSGTSGASAPQEAYMLPRRPTAALPSPVTVRPDPGSVRQLRNTLMNQMKVRVQQAQLEVKAEGGRKEVGEIGR